MMVVVVFRRVDKVDEEKEDKYRSKEWKSGGDLGYINAS